MSKETTNTAETPSHPSSHTHRHSTFKPPSTVLSFVIFLALTFIYRCLSLHSQSFHDLSLPPTFVFTSSPDTTPQPQVDVSHILKHLRVFDRIVDYHGGNRHASGTGYQASAKYVEKVLGQDSCDVLERQEFDAPYWTQLAPSDLSLVVGNPKPGSKIWHDAIIQLEEGKDYELVHGLSAQLVNVSV
ncbi:hypothetical protein FRB90_008584, partial [Tulasnella sp. 427]